MTVRGCMQNGVVVLSDGVHLPEGEEVTVLAAGNTLAGRKAHSILDIPPVTLGGVLHPLTADDDLLGKMLESRS